ncbi:MAG: hypothetical protein IJR55_00420 [Clostridia bacterium]|nr:hypothetical protein [Clostridia bacterium]
MKKILFWLILLSALLLSSCSSGIGMADILSYQNGDFSAKISEACDGGFAANIAKEGEGITLEIISPAELEGVRYEMRGGEFYICTGNMRIKLDGGAEKIENVFGCFMLDAGGGWKISTSKAGGTDVYKCVSGDTVAYFDKVTRCPYRIERGNVKIDILSFDGIKQNAAE